MSPQTITNNGKQNIPENKKDLLDVRIKIHILFPFQVGPKGGGGNQFLKALRYYWQSIGVYEDELAKADVVLFNSHHWLKKAFGAKRKFPSKIFIHRINGPLGSYRPKEAFLDKAIFKINSLVADGTVWQSKWSQSQNKKIFPYKGFETVIYNAPNEQIFNKNGKTEFRKFGKIKIIAASWSSSALKGFDIYKFLDENLDFRRYQMTFIGQNLFKFKNIKTLGPTEQVQLAKLIKQSDIFVSGSKVESCSNALIEALSCGLPCLAFNSSSNPEIIGKGGELFENAQDLLLKIEKIANNYLSYQKNLQVFSLEKTANAYFNFAKRIFDQAQSGFYITREAGVLAGLAFTFSNLINFCLKILNKIKK
ncbi:MAG: glycosyltransferase [Candidatus Pacebacteria bacterium]|nr:glycosyltransferase [Candidatus Paceibacterota bacterium]